MQAEQLAQEEFPDGLQQKHVSALLALDKKYEEECERTDRVYLQKCGNARQLFDGNQLFEWDSQSRSFVTANSTGGLVTRPNEADPEPYYVVNAYQAFYLSAAQVVCVNKPTQKFWPGSAERREDVEAAKAADDIVHYHELKNKSHAELVLKFWYWWLDGTFATYTRFVRDGERFGYEEVPAGEMAPQALPNGEMFEMPTQATKRQAKGGVIVDVIGGLELRLPSGCRELWQFPYLKWHTETDLALVKATYPHVAQKLRPDESTGSPSDDYARRQRERSRGVVTDRGQNVREHDSSRVTLKRTWFRYWSFYGIPDVETRDFLLQKYPDGVYLCWAEDLLCDAQGERMDDVWAVSHAMPGEGQRRQPIGGSLVQIQEMLNDTANIMFQTIKAGVPYMFGDTEVIDPAKVSANPPRPGDIFPALARQGKTLRESIIDIKGAPLSPEAMNFFNVLYGEIAQFETGMFPAAFGGDLGGNDTARGIALEQERALGRMALYWQGLKEHYAHGEMPQIVKAYSKHHKEIIRYAVAGPGGQPKDVIINPDALNHGTYSVQAEIDEGFPATWAQKRNQITFMMQNGLGHIVMDPANIETFKRTMGLEDFEIPGEKAWNKQLREIDELLKAQQPELPPGVPPEMAPPPQAPIPVIPFLEDHAAELAAIKYWWNTPARTEAQVQYPYGVQMILLHAQEHEAAMMQQAMMQQGGGMPPGAPPPEGGGGGGGEPVPEGAVAPPVGLSELPDPAQTGAA